MTAYLRLFVAAMAAEALLSLVISLGVYFGASIFPLLMDEKPVTTSSGISVTGSASSSTTVTSEGQFGFSLPMGMPVLQDLKMPHAALDPGELTFGIASVLLSAAAIVIQSYARAIYLGGLRSKVLHDRDADLIRCGNHYFKRMLGWSLVQWAAVGIAVGAGMIFIPLGLILLVVYLFYALTPYVFVLLDVRLFDALRVAPGLFRRMFLKLLPLALLALLATLLCGFIKLMPAPYYDYYFALVIYIPVGTYLIYELMSKLTAQLRAEGAGIPLLRLEPALRRRRMAGAAWLLLFLTVPLAGAAAATGYAYMPAVLGSQTAMDGTRFHTKASQAWHHSGQQYTTYGWRDIGTNRIRLSLPDLTGGKTVNEIRGVASVAWTMRDESRNPYTGATDVTETTRRELLQYRLGKQTTASGAVYYSSRAGAANLVGAMDRVTGPQSAEMLVSGDGKHVFVLVYPTSYRSLLQQAWRVSEDGRFLIPSMNHMYPDEFRYYWFQAGQATATDVFELLAAKNQATSLTVPRTQHLLATALQEADGHMVTELIRMMAHSEARLALPDWTPDEWTKELRARYAGMDVEEVLDYLSRDDEAARSRESLTPKEEGGNRSRMLILFPHGVMTLIDEEAADGSLRELTLDPNGRLME